LLVKPGDTCEETLDGRLRYPDPVGPQAVAEEVEALLDAPMKVLFGCFSNPSIVKIPLSSATALRSFHRVGVSTTTSSMYRM